MSTPTNGVDWGSSPPPANPGDYARWSLRIGGAVIDSLIALAAVHLIGVVSHPLGRVVQVGLTWSLWPYLLSRAGRTPGMAALGIRLVRAPRGDYPSFGLALGRQFAHLVDVASFGLGYVWPVWDARRQTFADKLCRTVVIRSR